MMLNYNPATGESGSCIIVGRGAIAILLALTDIEKRTGKVLLPANICYAAVLPVLYAGFQPIFCDVEPNSGNVTYDLIEQYITEDVVAAIIPHMYGNPVKDLPYIAKKLQSMNVILIEDCAALMAQDGSAYIPGTIGDYIIYSTGYSKTIDIGIGGLLFSRDRDLHKLEMHERQFKSFIPEYSELWGAFSRKYRALRNDGQNTDEAKRVYTHLPDAFKDSFQFSIDLKTKKRILESTEDLGRVIQERRRQYALYQDLLNVPAREQYLYAADAVPWRFNMFVSNDRERFISWCLAHNLPISDWYPRVTPMFDRENVFCGAEQHEKRIINFPLMITDQKVHEICCWVRAYYKGV